MLFYKNILYVLYDLLHLFQKVVHKFENKLEIISDYAYSSQRGHSN